MKLGKEQEINLEDSFSIGRRTLQEIQAILVREIKEVEKTFS
jgi:hypothetical protein